MYETTWFGKKSMKKHTFLTEQLFDKNIQLIDGTDEIFELDLALWEYKTLSTRDLIKRSAYFKLVDGKETNHFKACNLQNLEEIHKNSSFRTKLFFLNGKYSTGYATHSLFPYRGKFHPQLIRALLNILRVQPGDTVLDPMAGSGTVAVEANLLGIDSIAIDLNPLCHLMGKVKTFALDLDISTLESVSDNPLKLLKRLNKKGVPRYFKNKCKDEMQDYYEIPLLAFLDTMGFASRSNYSLETLFPRVLERYISTIRNFQKVSQQMKLKTGKSKIIQNNALKLPLEDNSVSAIITSPPYSFAIDYLKNDQPQLQYLDCNTDSLRENMIGLTGRGVQNKLDIYFHQMGQAIGEMKRVSKKRAPVVIIIGTNDIQTGGVNLESKIIEIGREHKLNLELDFKKSIRGIQNTMKHESILFFTNRK